MKSVAFLLVISIFIVPAQATVIFEDYFEDGTLNKWTIDGRQQGTNLAEVVEIESDKIAHLQHTGFTEITIGKLLTYSPLLNFEFDLKSIVSSPYGPHDNDYSAGGVVFDYLDESSNILGRVMYARSSSDYLFSFYNPLPNWHVFGINDNNFHTYSLNAADLLSNLEIEYASVRNVNFYFWAYASSDSYNSYADTWVDNVTVTPEPATLVLLAAGSVLALRRKRAGN